MVFVGNSFNFTLVFRIIVKNREHLFGYAKSVCTNSLLRIISSCNIEKFSDNIGVHKFIHFTVSSI